MFSFPLAQNVSVADTYEDARVWACLEEAGIADDVRGPLLPVRVSPVPAGLCAAALLHQEASPVRRPDLPAVHRLVRRLPLFHRGSLIGQVLSPSIHISAWKFRMR